MKDEAKAIAGKYGKVSKKGLYTGAILGRLSGGYAGMELSEAALPKAEIIELYPQLNSGSLGPEEAIVYTSVVGGYILGGVGFAKGVTKYQEIREKDLKYTRPFLKPFESLQDVKEFLSDEEVDEDKEENIRDAISHFFDEK